MIVRGVDTQNDWMYGAGKNSYKSGINAVAQNIKTRLQSFLGDCFFSLESGIDWFNLNGSKNIDAVTLAVRATILNTPEVVSLNEVTVRLDEQRNLSMVYNVNTIYGSIVESQSINFTPDLNSYLLWQGTSFLTLEDLGKIIL